MISPLQFEEAGLSFYSYFILIRVLRNRERIFFLVSFWFLMLVILVVRMFILVNRQRNIVQNSPEDQDLIRHLHIGYFTSIAVVEILSSYFLLKKFRKTKKTAANLPTGTSVMRYLMRSTEIRLATLAIIGITRAVTYSFQNTAQSATAASGQVDRFIATLEVMFPVVMIIDLLASKLHSARGNSHRTDSSSFNRAPSNGLAPIKSIPRDQYSLSEIDGMGHGDADEGPTMAENENHKDVENGSSNHTASYESVK